MWSLAMTSFCVINGASGGPVYKDHIAYGLWTGHFNALESGGCGYGWFQSLTKAATAMKVSPADLTLLSQKNKGVFPRS